MKVIKVFFWSMKRGVRIMGLMKVWMVKGGRCVLEKGLEVRGYGVRYGGGYRKRGKILGVKEVEEMVWGGK